MLDWVKVLGGNEVTLYAFSIENFKRPKNEVDGLMDLLRDNLKAFLGPKFPKLVKEGMCLRLWGNIDLLPPDIQQLFAKLILATQSHDQ